jgi:hypothetical protein
VTNLSASGGEAGKEVAPARQLGPGGADEVLDSYAEKLDVYWRNVIHSRNEPGELANWVKCIFLEGYQAGRADQS